jgi:hypothetical protein
MVICSYIISDLSINKVLNCLKKNHSPQDVEKTVIAKSFLQKNPFYLGRIKPRRILFREFLS